MKQPYEDERFTHWVVVPSSSGQFPECACLCTSLKMAKDFVAIYGGKIVAITWEPNDEQMANVRTVNA